MPNVECKPPDPVFYREAEWTDGCNDTRDPGWYFWDEIWSDAMGPYDTEEVCRKRLCAYAKAL